MQMSLVKNSSFLMIHVISIFMWLRTGSGGRSPANSFRLFSLSWLTSVKTQHHQKSNLKITHHYWKYGERDGCGVPQGFLCHETRTSPRFVCFSCINSPDNNCRKKTKSNVCFSKTNVWCYCERLSVCLGLISSTRANNFTKPSDYV